jgi:hypothetical protein
MKYNKELISHGYEIMKHLNVAICSIVRNCNKRLINNIPAIECVRKLFHESIVIVFENGSIDGTKETLKNWVQNSKNVVVMSEDLDIPTVPDNCDENGVNKFFSSYRISKMAMYRNRYLEKLYDSNFAPDYVIIVDLDISRINLPGIVHSFSIRNEWDVVCANGISYSPSLKKLYHDAYALVELGKQTVPQTEKSIFANQRLWSFLRPGFPLIPIYSAYGGLSIYRYDAIKGKRYSVIKNDDSRIEVRCEHYSLCHAIREAGNDRIYINPNMTLKYQDVSVRSLIYEYTNNTFKLLS